MTRGSKRTFELIGILILAITLIGCGGGGGAGSDSDTDSPPTTSPSIQVLPTAFDFGIVTTGNSPAPLEVKINNNGTGALNVSNINLSDITNFSLNMSGGSSPCGTISPTIAAASTCTFEVSFQPNTDSSFSANVQINSNDNVSPSFNLKLSGISEPASSLIVRINQIETTCANYNFIAYVSVTDQGGYPFTALSPAHFSIVESGAPAFSPVSAEFVSIAYESISIAAVMDYSGSITDTPDAVTDMESGLVGFVQNLQSGDNVEIIKFDSEYEVVLPFSSDKDALRSAILAPFDKGANTKLYDAVYQAVENTALKSNRRAVIVITDGVDDNGSGSPLSSKTLPEVIANAVAKGVPIFPIGIATYINVAILDQMAVETGGQFFRSITSDNLKTIYQQLSSVLFENQYVLKYQSKLNGGVPATLGIEANYPGTNKGNATMPITACP